MNEKWYEGHEFQKKIREKPRPSLLMRIWAFFFRKEIIKLTSWQGEVYWTYKKLCACGKYHAHVYWGSGVGDVILEDDGKINPRCSSFYIVKWEDWNVHL